MEGILCVNITGLHSKPLCPEERGVPVGQDFAEGEVEPAPGKHCKRPYGKVRHGVTTKVTTENKEGALAGDWPQRVHLQKSIRRFTNVR